MDKWGGNIGVSEQTVKRNIGKGNEDKIATIYSFRFMQFPKNCFLPY
jgi:hypothetical protein